MYPILSIVVGSLLLAGCAATATAPIALAPRTAPPPLLLPTAPTQYTVQPNDHIWAVADQFTAQPWRWNELWPEPTPLFAGDTIEIASGEVAPRLRLAAGGPRPIIKVSPQVRVQPLDQPIPVIPRIALRSFLQNAVVTNDDEWEDMPYVVGADDGRMIFDGGTTVYARGEYFQFRNAENYQVLRPAETYRDPQDGESLGRQLIYLADARLVRFDDESELATLTLGRTHRPILPGDRLLVLPDENELINFNPEAAPPNITGQVISHLDNKTLAGRFDSVVLNLGNDQVKVGHVLRIDTPNSQVTDPVTQEQVQLPDRRSGLVMVYRVFENVSYALVMEAQRPVRKADRVSSL